MLTTSFVTAIVAHCLLLSVAAAQDDPLQCPQCTAEDVARCPPMDFTSGDCQPVLEPNCGCCLMCARKEGENCGNGVGECETELRCGPAPDMRRLSHMNLILAWLAGRFVCEPAQRQTPPPQVANTESPPCRRQRIARHRRSNPPRPKFSKHAKSCFKHEDAVFAKDHFAKHEWVPSCAEDGSYLPEQCELTHGRQRGRCWCVNRSGVARGGFNDPCSLDACREESASTPATSSPATTVASPAASYPAASGRQRAP